MTLLNCTGYHNGGYNFSVPGFIRTGETLMVKNCIALGPSGVTLAGVPDAILETNSWLPPFTGATDADFITIDTTGVRGPRKADGSLPDIDFMHLATGSQFIDAGTNVGMPFYGTKPDLGCFESGGPVGVTAATTARVADFKLFQNYPNPFNPTTVISFVIGKQGLVILRVYNVLGQLVKELYRGIAEAGIVHQVTLDATHLPSGIYFYSIESGGRQIVKRMALIK